MKKLLRHQGKEVQDKLSTHLEFKNGGLAQSSNPFSKRKLAFADQPLSTDPHAQNPVFVFKTRKKCKFCEGVGFGGRPKHFPNLWSLYMHNRIHHPNEPTQLQVIRSLAEIVIQEMQK